MGLEDWLSEALGISAEKCSSILKSRSTKRIAHNDVTILSFKREIAGYPEGTVVMFHRHKKIAKVIPGYPPIPRLLLIESIKDIFPGEVIVEEKINGYNVRVFEFDGKIYTLTRGGNPCPYTYHRIMRSYGEKLKKVLEGSSNIIIFGEAYGYENPYVRYKGYKNISFGFVVFDILVDGRFLPISERDSIIKNYDLSLPSHFGTFSSNEYSKILALSVRLEGKGVEGFILRDRENTIRIKYTLTTTNVGDIEEGMRFFFEEGRTYIFPRILREIFRQYELKKNDLVRKSRTYHYLGKSLLEPAIESVIKTARGEISDEEFTLRVYDLKILDEFVEFMNKMKIPIHIVNIFKDGESYVAHYIKTRRTPLKIKDILKTGISPED